MNDNSVCTCAAILGITTIETALILTHQDGTLLALVVAAIAGLGGYHIKKLREK